MAITRIRIFPSTYDDVAYGGHTYDETHPGRLSTIAAFYGLEAPDIETCRVLELGCGNGRNLLPMAYQYPDARFVGIDLSARAIEAAAEHAGAYGLKNVEVRHCDILDVTPEWGRFDFIAAHGVYSWVPAAVREKMLTIFHDNLSPRGVGYVSYNAYPGSHLRNMTRDMMHFHIRQIAEPQRRITQSRAILGIVAEGSDAKTVHGAVMRDQYARVQRMPDELLFHDDLLEITTPFLLHEVASQAERHGLQYLSDAFLSRRDLRAYPEKTRAILASFPDSEFMARDQYQDFIDGHGFRRTLLCHTGVKLNRKVDPDCVVRFHLASSAAPMVGEIDPAAAGAVEFKTEHDHTLATDHLLTKAALIELGKAWPAAIAFAELVERSRRRLGTAIDSAASEHVIALTYALFQAVSAGHVEIHKHAPKLTTTISPKPEASLLARKQAETEKLITNLRHRMVLIEDERVRRFLLLVDGTRDVDNLVRDFAAAVPETATEPVGITRASIEQNLRFLADLALLVA